MAIYRIDNDNLLELSETSFVEAGLKERGDIQRLLRSRIEVLGEDLLVIAEEFGGWDESKRRIDLLCVDKQANLVVVELKRTQDGGHMELQALRYAAMVSTMTFEQAVEVFRRYLCDSGSDQDPLSTLLDHFEREEPDEDSFAQDVRIVLAAADFSKELTTAVMWLSGRDLDIRCIRLRPYRDGGQLLLDVQQVIPLPEAEDYRVRIKEKQQQERRARKSGPDLTKYDVTVGGMAYSNLPKRAAIFTVVRALCSQGHAPEEINRILPWKKNTLFRWAEGHCDETEFLTGAAATARAEGRAFEEHRYYTKPDELFHHNGRTYALTNQWGLRTKSAIETLAEAFPEAGIELKPSE